MTPRQPKYSPKEHAERGAAMYEQVVRPAVKPADAGRIAAIDIETGAFAIGDSSLQASKKLLERVPDAQIWCVKIGDLAVHHFGPRRTAG